LPDAGVETATAPEVIPPLISFNIDKTSCSVNTIRIQNAEYFYKFFPDIYRCLRQRNPFAAIKLRRSRRQASS
jgi:hypothetical protein